jgi:hypothetical protein
MVPISSLNPISYAINNDTKLAGFHINMDAYKGKNVAKKCQIYGVFIEKYANWQ